MLVAFRSCDGSPRRRRNARYSSYPHHRIERYYGSFSRSFTLPSTVELGTISAAARDGVLRIFLPKKSETKPRQIKVEVESTLPGVLKQKQ